MSRPNVVNWISNSIVEGHGQHLPFFKLSNALERAVVKIKICLGMNSALLCEDDSLGLEIKTVYVRSLERSCEHI